MTKVNLLTIHYGKCYGAVMQTFATCRMLEQAGHTVRVINLINPSQKGNWKSIHYWMDCVREFQFWLFKKMYFSKLTNKAYSIKDINLPKSDVTVVGSDQVWSPYRNRRIAFFDYFFLNFVLNSSKKYSYAPSFGTTDLSSNYLDCIKKALNSFNKISCREVALARKLSELTQKEIVPVIDPTLLLDRTEWKKVCKPVFGMPSEYILCYILGEKKTISQFAEKLSKEKKIPVYYILTRPYYLEKQNCLTGVGPGEFLSLIMNASFVCTDSFHGTIFSINFNVPFYSFTKRESTDSINDNDRIQLVLKEFGLENRFKHDTDMYSNDVFICADEILSTRRLQSGYFLQSIIDETF